MPLTDDQKQALRAKLSARGSDLNSKIMALQAGKTLPANETDVPFAEPGEEPEVRMKRFLHIIQGKMKRLGFVSDDYIHLLILEGFPSPASPWVSPDCGTSI